jgi:hypothetical protein
MAFFRPGALGVQLLCGEYGCSIQHLLTYRTAEPLGHKLLAEVERATKAGDEQLAREFVPMLADAYRRLQRLGPYATDEGTAEQDALFARCRQHEVEEVERTLRSWCQAAGVTPEELAKHYGYYVVRSFDGENFSVRVVEHPLDRSRPPSWTEKVFPKALADKTKSAPLR